MNHLCPIFVKKKLQNFLNFFKIYEFNSFFGIYQKNNFLHSLRPLCTKSNVLIFLSRNTFCVRKLKYSSRLKCRQNFTTGDLNSAVE